MEESLPSEFLKKYKLKPLDQMIRILHNPQTMEEVDQAKYRVFFERLLKLQLLSLISKNEYQEHHKKESDGKPEMTRPDRDIVREFLQTLPYDLTNSQKKALKEIITDIHEGSIR